MYFPMIAQVTMSSPLAQGFYQLDKIHHVFTVHDVWGAEINPIVWQLIPPLFTIESVHRAMPCDARACTPRAGYGSIQSGH